jgi:hypothetical protein
VDWKLILLDLSFLINYVGVSEADPRTGARASVKFTPVLIWICWGVTDADSESTFYNRRNEDAPIIFILSPDESIKIKLANHFRDNDRRLQRLQAFPEWILLDLEILLSKWTDIWDLARRELVLQNWHVNCKWRQSQLFNLIKMLHLDIANIIALKEDLRLQKSATLRFQKLLSRMHGQPSTPLASPSSTTQRFEDVSRQFFNAEIQERLEDNLYRISHQQETSEVILKQFENLLSLVGTYILILSLSLSLLAMVRIVPHELIGT